MRLYADLFAAGHHTTFQHATFVFVLDNVSRLAIWSFFHAHPFYNSEQVSQRYREVSGDGDGHARLPGAPTRDLPGGDRAQPGGLPPPDRILTPDLQRDYAAVFPARAKAQGAGRRAAGWPTPSRSGPRRSPATSCRWRHRPTSTTRSMALTLLRYYVLANQPDAPTEVRYIVNRMVDEVLAVDPTSSGAPGVPARPAAARRRRNARGAARSPPGGPT